LTAATVVFIILSARFAFYARGVAAMVKNIVAGLTLAGLILLVVLAYAQKHEACWEGHRLKSFKPCGSLSSQI
jgi:hypothetical protein